MACCHIWIESWILRKANETRINAFEMKCLRFVLRISWTEERTNEWVLQSAGSERHLLKSVKKRKMTYFEHKTRKKEKCLEKEIINGTKPGDSTMGIPKTSWLGNIRFWTGLTTEELLRTGNDRSLLYMLQSTLEPRMTKNRTHWLSNA